MSKKITHERMKAIIDFNSEYYEEIIDYITQQEKQQKLLELYQQFYKILNKGGRTVADIEAAIKLEEQIKELENEE